MQSYQLREARKAGRRHGGLMLAELNTDPPIGGTSCLTHQRVLHVLNPTYVITQVRAFPVWPFMLVNTSVHSSTKTYNQLDLTAYHQRF
jgi:hypothetical protein